MSETTTVLNGLKCTLMTGVLLKFNEVSSCNTPSPLDETVLLAFDLQTHKKLAQSLRRFGSTRVWALNRFCSKSYLQLRSPLSFRPMSSIPTATSSTYLAVHVRGTLIDGASDEFYKETLENARNSILEPGVSRFDVLRSVENANQFLLIEVYKDGVNDPEKHKQTAHYKNWRVAVEPYMAMPRDASRYRILYPPPHLWDTSEVSSTEEVEAYQAHRPWHRQPLEHAEDGSEGGVLVQLYEVTVTKGQERALVDRTMQWCREAVREVAAHRVDFLASCANSDTPDASSFLLVVMLNSPGPAPAFVQQWVRETAASAIHPLALSQYVTLFPSPRYYRAHTALAHAGEVQRFSLEAAAEAAPDSAVWAGRRGLATTNLSAGMFGFQGPKILMGRDIAAKAIRDTCKALGLRRPLIVTGSGGLQRNAALFEAVFPLPEGDGQDTGSVEGDEEVGHYTTYAASVAGEPTIEDAQRIVALATSLRCDSVLAVGGGSALDVGKAVAALVPNAHREVTDFLEVIGKGLPLERDPLPFIAVPTTSGTGSEATKNAVLKSVQHGLKVSIRHEKMFPVAAILDPTLTLSCPPSVTAHVGMDTLCQCLEPYLCCVPNPFVDALAEEGIVRAARSLRDAVNDGATNIEAREDMAVASVMGGLSLANAKLGAVHGFAAVLGGRFENAPHGALCAALLPFVFEANAEYLRALVSGDGGEGQDQDQDQDQDQGGKGTSGAAAPMGAAEATVRLARFQEAAQMITSNPKATIRDGARWLHALMRDIGIPRLRDLCPELARLVHAGGGAEGAATNPELQSIVTATMNASSTKGNPVVLSKEQLTDILLKAL